MLKKEKLMWASFGLLLVVALFVVGSLFATSAKADTTKYDTSFSYSGVNNWDITPLAGQQALHNIGVHQAWLCNSNNVGPGILPCVVGQTYMTTGEENVPGVVIDPDGTHRNVIFESCVYIQGDSPAFDTVPGDADKRVCVEATTPTATPTPSVTPTVISTGVPSSIPTVVPSSVPTTEATATPTPVATSSVITTPVSSSTPRPVRTKLGVAVKLSNDTPKSPMTQLANTGFDPVSWLVVVAVCFTVAFCIFIEERHKRKAIATNL